ncbi:941_t:CDS:1, partial [Entrophospora sp. SA101]
AAQPKVAEQLQSAADSCSNFRFTAVETVAALDVNIFLGCNFLVEEPSLFIKKN